MLYISLVQKYINWKRWRTESRHTDSKTYQRRGLCSHFQQYIMGPRTMAWSDVVQFNLFLNMHVQGSRGTAPCRNTFTIWSWVVSFKPWPLYTGGKAPRTHYIWGCLDLRACLKALMKNVCCSCQSSVPYRGRCADRWASKLMWINRAQ
jgi:hypothetical protein